MNNITVNMDNLTTDERNTLLKLIEKASKPKNKVWKPELNEMYYAISDVVNIFETRNNSEIDDKRHNIGNCFKTKEEAEFALEKQKVFTELKRFALENNECELDWNDYTTNKCCLYYNRRKSEIDVSCNNIFSQAAVIYFSSEKIAKEAIKTIGENRLKKYYFEVNDNE